MRMTLLVGNCARHSFYIFPQIEVLFVQKTFWVLACVVSFTCKIVKNIFYFFTILQWLFLEPLTDTFQLLNWTRTRRGVTCTALLASLCICHLVSYNFISDHLWWWNCVHQLEAVSVFVWASLANNLVVFHSSAWVKNWRTGVEWAIHQHLIVWHLVPSSSCVFTYHQLPLLKMCTQPQPYSEGDFAHPTPSAPEFFWL